MVSLMQHFTRYTQLVPLSNISTNTQKQGSDNCPASFDFATVCERYSKELTVAAALLDFHLTYLLVLHEFWQRFEETAPEHQPCLLAVFAQWYKAIRKRELARITAMSLQPGAPPAAQPDYPDLVGFDEEEEDETEH